MTHVRFHFNVADRTDYTCRLLRKATRQGVRVAVSGPAIALVGLDRALWSFDPFEFVPHVRLAAGQVLPDRLRATPVCLVERATDAPMRDVLVNFGSDTPEGFEAFERVVEVVSTTESDRIAARQRWRDYAARGLAIERHEVPV